MRVLVCVKRVPSPGARIGLTEDGLAVDSTHLGFTTSPHEECAVEEAVQLVEGSGAGGEVVVMTAGPPEAEEQLRYATSVGAHRIVLIPNGDGRDWDPEATARALTDGVLQLEQQGGPFDLILFGNESADSGGYQVGIRVANALGRPIVNGAKGIDAGPGGVTVRRPCEGGFELYRLPTPAVVGVREGINLPRYPTMRGRLASKKVAMETMAATPRPGGLERVKLHRPVEVVSEPTILGDGPEAAGAIVDLLQEIGLA